MNTRRLITLIVLTVAVSLAHTAPSSASLGVIAGSPFGSGNGGVAVDPITGDVYQAEPATNRVSKYSEAGTFILMFGKEVNETTGGNICPENPSDTCKAAATPANPPGAGELDSPEGVAVDPNTHDVYVNAGAGGCCNTVDNRVERFSSSGQYVSQIVGGQNSAPEFEINPFASGIAVDAQGDLYVASDGSQLNGKPIAVLKFNQAGEYTGQQFRLKTGSPVNVAVDANGTVYAAREGSPKAVVKFSPNGVELEPPLSCRNETEAGLAVNLFNGDVFVAGSASFNHRVEEEPYVCVYDAAGALLEEFKAVSQGEELGKLAYGASVGRLYEAFSSGVWMYGTFPTPPEGAPSISQEDWSTPGLTSITLSARVNPYSLDTKYYFQYATSPDLSGALSEPAPPGADAGSSFLPVSESVDLTGLSQSTTYYYRMVAHNAFGGGPGSTTDGAIQSFTTLAPLPAVTTEGAPEAEIANNAATAHGTVIPGSTGAASNTLWCFQYGTADVPGYDLGFLPGAPAGEAGQGTTPVPVSVRLTRLQPETTYRYRLVAVNSLGSRLSSTACGSEGGHETDGAEGTFTTGATGPGPLAASGPLAALSQNAASLTGTVDPRGTSTVYDFQLGTGTSYGVDLFGPAGAGSGSEPVGVTVSALQPGTTYHYRLVASSRFGTSYGADQSFATPGFPTSVLSAPPAPPLIATQPFVFPTESNPGAPVSKCRRGYSRDKHGRCLKAKPKRKVKRRGKGARQRRK